MSSTWILISLVLTIAALVVMLAVFKLHPVIGLFASAILAGLLVKMPLTDLASALSAGFGGTLVALGLVVAFGTILSYYLEKSGAIDELAKWMVRTLGPKNDVLALGIASYIISIPVFFGSAYIDQKQVLRSVSLPCTLASIVVFLCILLLNAFSGVLPGLY